MGLREAAQQALEPVGEIILQDTKYHGRAMAVKPCGKNGVLPEGTKLYAAPPQRKPLTEAFLAELAEKHVTNCYFDTLTYARALERAHGIGGEK